MKKIIISSLILFFLSLSCKENLVGTENQIANINDFVESQNLPQSQAYHTLLDVSKEGFSYFTVNYGKLNDPVRGGFYSTAIGIRLKNKIGWIKLEDYEQLDDSNYQFYNIEITDTYLFSENLFQLVDSVFGNSNTERFCAFIINDTDTPIEALKKVTLFLYKFSFPAIANSIVEIPQVQLNREILELLVNLPVFPYGDGYITVRTRANELLNNLGGG